MQIRYRRLHPSAVPPVRATADAAGFDLTAVTRTYDAGHSTWIYGTGLALEIPAGYVGLLFPRSSIYRTSYILANCVGVIDADFRGEVKVLFRKLQTACEDHEDYAVGDRIAQLLLLPLPDISFTEAEELSETERGEGGYGSTGRTSRII